MIRAFLFFALLLPNRVMTQYLFNTDTSKALYKGFTNTFICDKGTPLCFDGSIKITPSDKENQYFVEVLDTVNRNKGKLNITKYLVHPDGFKEKVFIDKFSFQIRPLPETNIFIGESISNQKIDTNNLDLSVGLLSPYPQTSFVIKEFTLMANKKALIIKSRKITPQAVDFIKALNAGTRLEIEVRYTDELKKERRVLGSFFL